MNVREIMTHAVECCRPHDTMAHAAQLMWEHDCGAIPVIDDDAKPIAMITDRDIAMASYTQGQPLFALPVSLAMSKRIVTCVADEPIAVAERLMRAQQVRRLPVVDRTGKIVGILSLNDIATHGRARRGELGAQAVAGTLSAICAKTPTEMAAE